MINHLWQSVDAILEDFIIIIIIIIIISWNSCFMLYY